ncbi:class I SAM-dependent methyltransferase [Polaromonas sp. SM01]|uniref:class I SAM-dependent methyltransferase n=1 Tax=Polaromonas sp. SM01 TaxID=3085630 RepID=UPI0029817F41|nr:class I SAM-dependent methyltransferase [Polaromonas sp. SM01]MDW5441802.1 class I SAM-dependent methyltransferase [Polaromonas sp. SM01]
MPAHTEATDQALAALLHYLRGRAYEFSTVTPLTHARVLANRHDQTGASLRDIFGWSLAFAAQSLPSALLEPLLQSGVLQREGERWYRSRVRVASVDGELFIHSAFPTLAPDAVFFGPDTYRFFNLVRDNLPANRPDTPLRVADVGCGSGAGGIMAARLRVGAHVTLNDINPLALRYAGINAAFAGLEVELALGDALSATAGDFDVVLSNPPYLVDDAARAYRHGGGDLGLALSLRIGAQALQRLLPGGRLILYTGVAMVDGADPFIQAMEPFLGQAGCTYTYAEIDPDVFGEELARPVYRRADRIAAVGLVAVKA